MHRVLGALFALVFLFGVSGSNIAAVAAQEMADHPILGSWMLDADPDDPANPPSLVVFTSDGSYLEVDAEGGVGVGAWESTGANSGNLTIRFLDSEVGGMGIIRASFEVAEDGDSFTAEYTIEFVDIDGESTGEYGPAPATGTRAGVEPMGEPEGSLEDLFSLWEDATPEASPEG